MVNDSGTVLYEYDMDAFGRYLGDFGNALVNPHRFGGAWGYMTDPSGLLQLGATRSAGLGGGSHVRSG